MRIAPWSNVVLVFAVILAGGCGNQGLNPGDKNVTSATSIPTECPSNIDPDSRLSGNEPVTPDECPDFWVCTDQPGKAGAKVCYNPGPDLPDASHSWNCTEQAGTNGGLNTIVCTGSSFPDNGGDTTWSCAKSGEMVQCTRPVTGNGTGFDYPSEGGDGTWTCKYDELGRRVCESGGGSSNPGGSGGPWECKGNAGDRVCTQAAPSFPDAGGDGKWSCFDLEGVTYCSRPGTSIPTSTSEWNCRMAPDVQNYVECRHSPGDFPDAGGDSTWNCIYSGELRVCSDSSNPGVSSSSEPPCVNGKWRWCDSHIYCAWGKQQCKPDGTWGECIEPVKDPTKGFSDRPATECACRYPFYNKKCCETPDCIIPDNHKAPTCTRTKDLCGYCDVDAQCSANGSSTNVCVAHDPLNHSDAYAGYTFCARDCSANPNSCPTGFRCSPIRRLVNQDKNGDGKIDNKDFETLHQCTPNSGFCQ